MVLFLLIVIDFFGDLCAEGHLLEIMELCRMQGLSNLRVTRALLPDTLNVIRLKFIIFVLLFFEDWQLFFFYFHLLSLFDNLLLFWVVVGDIYALLDQETHLGRWLSEWGWRFGVRTGALQAQLVLNWGG